MASAGGYLGARQVHVDQFLSQMAMNYRMQGFIADRVMPVVNVQKQTDLYPIWDQATLFLPEDTKRSPATRANRISVKVSSASYAAENFALAMDVTLEDRINADPIFISEFEAGRAGRVMDKLQLDWELRVASLAFNTANVGSSTAVTSAWTDRANSNPITDLQSGILNIEQATGYRPNRAVFGGLAWHHMRLNNNVKNIVVNPPGGPNVSGAGRYPSVGEVAAALELEQILVGNTYYNNANAGQPLSLARIWPDSVLLYYAPAAPSREVPSFAYAFRWAAAGLPNMTVERHPYQSQEKTDTVEIGYYQAEKVTGKPLGFLVTNVTSSN